MSGGTRSYEMAKRMVSAGHEVHLVTSYRGTDLDSNEWFETNEAGIHVHWLPVAYSNHMSYRQRIAAFLSFALGAREKAKDLQGDVVFATSTPLTIAIPAVLAARKQKIPMVFEVRDLWPEMPIAMGALKNPVLRCAARKLEHWAYRNASAVVALSPGMKAGVVDTDYPSAQVAVIPNSSDNVEFQFDAQAAHEFRAARPWLGDMPLLVYTGTFGKVNGVGYMVELAKALKEIGSDVKILLVGDGQERQQVMEAARDAEVYGENLFMEEKLPKKDVPALMSASSMASALFIDLPEMQSNSANKFFDALASGTPILLNYGGWMHELVESHGCGLAMWRKPIDEVAKTIDDKLHDEDWLQSAGRASRQLAECYFDRDKLASQLIEVIESAVHGEGRMPSDIAPGEYQ